MKGLIKFLFLLTVIAFCFEELDAYKLFENSYENMLHKMEEWRQNGLHFWEG